MVIDGPGNTCELKARTYDHINYEWTVRYVYRAPDGMIRTTAWSEWVRFTVWAYDLGGCNAGLGVLPAVLLFFAALTLRPWKIK